MPSARSFLSRTASSAAVAGPLRRAPLTLGALMLAVALPAQAADFPDHSIRLFVGYPAGGGVDAVARALAERMTEQLDQTVVVENRTGATGTIAADATAKANPDGYTLLFAETGLLIAKSVMADLRVDAVRDFTPVAGVARLPLAIGVHPELPVQTTQDLIDLLKENPGKYSYGSAGMGTVHHFVFELFKKEAGVDAAHIPYKGGAPMLPDLIEGRLEIGMLSSSIGAPHVASGKIRALAVTTAEPVSNLPGVPPLADTLPGVDAAASFFVLAPRGTPEDRVQTLYDAIAASVEDPIFLEVLKNQGALPNAATPDALKAQLEAEDRQWADVAEVAGISAN